MNISEIVDKKTITPFLPPEDVSAIFALFESDEIETLINSTRKVVRDFGIKRWDALLEPEETQERKDLEIKLATSFHNNLMLLIQKTWVEKADETNKEQILYEVDQFCEHSTEDYKTHFMSFATTVRKAVALMFGQDTLDESFVLYAFRIDPLFGLFWWITDSAQRILQEGQDWSEEKCRIFLLIGMFFISNY